MDFLIDPYRQAAPVPPVLLTLTSRPYAPGWTDELDGGSSMRKAGTYQPPIDPLDITGSVPAVSIVQVVRYGSTDMGVESLDLTGSVPSVALTVVVRYGAYDMGSESLDLTGSVPAVALDPILVSNTIPPESLDITGSVPAVSLT